jgi:hypothetical protein
MVGLQLKNNKKVPLPLAVQAISAMEKLIG